MSSNPNISNNACCFKSAVHRNTNLQQVFIVPEKKNLQPKWFKCSFQYLFKRLKHFKMYTARGTAYTTSLHHLQSEKADSTTALWYLPTNQEQMDKGRHINSSSITVLSITIPIAKIITHYKGVSKWSLNTSATTATAQLPSSTHSHNHFD